MCVADCVCVQVLPAPRVQRVGWDHLAHRVSTCLCLCCCCTLTGCGSFEVHALQPRSIRLIISGVSVFWEGAVVHVDTFAHDKSGIALLSTGGVGSGACSRTHVYMTSKECDSDVVSVFLTFAASALCAVCCRSERQVRAGQAAVQQLSTALTRRRLAIRNLSTCHMWPPNNSTGLAVGSSVPCI
jgi:hypothetical protein